MIIGIIGAMDEEVRKLKDEMTIENKLTKAKMEFLQVSFWGKMWW